MEYHFRYFKNDKCEFFPCHKVSDTDEFNCLFCYCPLYALGDKCGGNFGVIVNGIKDCSQCLIPHKENSLDYIMSKWQQITDMLKEQQEKKERNING